MAKLLSLVIYLNFKYSKIFSSYCEVVSDQSENVKDSMWKCEINSPWISSDASDIYWTTASFKTKNTNTFFKEVESEM